MKDGKSRRDGNGRYEKGASGNPNGRPRKTEPFRSPFEVLFDQTVSFVRDGQRQELTTEDAIALKLYEKALAGDRRAQVKIMAMMREWTEWHQSRSGKIRPTPPSVVVEAEQWIPDREMMMLDICRKDRSGRFVISNWVVESALKRSARTFSEEQLEDIRFNTARPQDITWPKAARDER